MRGSGESVTITVEGAPVVVTAGLSLAAALLESGHAVLRPSPRSGAPRGSFCLMGACQECAILVDGAVERACLVPVRAGMEVRLAGAHEG